MKSSADSLLIIINDVLDLSKIDAGKLQLDPVPVDVRKLMTDRLKPFLFGAQQKGLTMPIPCGFDQREARRADARTPLGSRASPER